jgi:hypothetical protein
VSCSTHGLEKIIDQFHIHLCFAHTVDHGIHGITVEEKLEVLRMFRFHCSKITQIYLCRMYRRSEHPLEIAWSRLHFCHRNINTKNYILLHVLYLNYCTYLIYFSHNTSQPLLKTMLPSHKSQIFPFMTSLSTFTFTLLLGHYLLFGR